jgi:hypothetical protein
MAAESEVIIMKKLLGILLAVAVLTLSAGAVEAKTVIKKNGPTKIKVTTSGNANVSINSSVKVASSSSYFSSCKCTYTVTSNGGGTNTVSGDCEKVN